MATFIALMNFTDQGIRNIKESPDRYEKFKSMAGEQGVTFKDVLGSLGNVRSQTLRGFSAEEMKGIVSNMS